MQTEFPRNEMIAAHAAREADTCASAAFDASGLTEDDVALIDLRYDQFIAQAELDHLMDDL